MKQVITQLTVDEWDNKTERFVTVLETPQGESAETAVRVQIVKGVRSRK
jgi:hypothetical protein